ncbi:hypothetical protein [Campylobacter concisus]|uniref:hypothetical protein n=1 Tax=Campylobacter concisus TaxID=199 RepID=UPI003D248E56
MKYAHYDKNTNEILGFYDDAIHNNVPSPNIKLTDEQWQEAIRINANYIEKGKLIFKQKEPSDADKKQAQILELERQIKEIEGLIRNALLIGNNAVLEELRAEYKELLNQKEILKGEDNEKEN